MARPWRQGFGGGSALSEMSNQPSKPVPWRRMPQMRLHAELGDGLGRAGDLPQAQLGGDAVELLNGALVGKRLGRALGRGEVGQREEALGIGSHEGNHSGGAIFFNLSRAVGPPSTATERRDYRYDRRSWTAATVKHRNTATRVKSQRARRG